MYNAVISPFLVNVYNILLYWLIRDTYCTFMQKNSSFFHAGNVIGCHINVFLSVRHCVGVCLELLVYPPFSYTPGS